MIRLDRVGHTLYLSEIGRIACSRNCFCVLHLCCAICVCICKNIQINISYMFTIVFAYDGCFFFLYWTIMQLALAETTKRIGKRCVHKMDVFI